MVVFVVPCFCQEEGLVSFQVAGMEQNRLFNSFAFKPGKVRTFDLCPEMINLNVVALNFPNRNLAGVRFKPVIRVQKHDILAGCLFHSPFPGKKSSPVFWQREDPEPRILRIALENFPGPVR